MTRFTHKDKFMDMDYGKATVYDGGRLMFKGCAYVGIKTFIRLCEYDPAVMERFRMQLELREKPPFKTNSEDKTYQQKP